VVKHKNTQTDNNRRQGGTGKRKGKLLWIIVLIPVISGAAIVFSGWMRTPLSTDTGGASSTFTVREDNLVITVTASSTFTVREDNLVITVTESGNIKAQESTDIMCEVEGRGVEISSIVPEGTVVTPEDVANGKILCQLNASELQDYYNRELISFSTAKSNYLGAQETHLIQKKQNESDIAAAQLAVEFGLMDLQNYLGEKASLELVDDQSRDPNIVIEIATLLEFLEDPNSLGGEASQMLKQYQNNILLAEGQFEKTTDVLTGTQKLHDANYASDLDLKSAQLDVNRFRIQKERLSGCISSMFSQNKQSSL